MASANAASVIYPNLGPMISLDYTCSHGIQPGTVVIRTQPGSVAPVAGGDVVFYDSRKAVRVKRCKLERFTSQRDDSGITWTLEISDSRWRWKDGRIDGVYNQLDSHSKLYPKQVRSPTELAILCLEQMGVSRYIVDMPDGLTKAAAAGFPDILPTGINFPQIGINPPVSWFADNPASCLAQLAESMGRNVVYDVVTDTVLVVRPGLGGGLPAGSVANVTPSMVAPETPDAVSVVGDPTRYEALFELYAVGLEWDGSLRPINELSYAPTVTTQQKHTVSYKITKYLDGKNYGFTIGMPDNNDVANFTHPSTAGDTILTVLTALKAICDGTTQPSLAGKITTEIDGEEIIFTGVQDGYVFDVSIFENSNIGPAVVVVTQVGVKVGKTWAFAPPPLFPGIVATDRLTRLQALALAQKSVFKMYRLTGRDVATGKAPMMIPGFGTSVRSDINLLDEMCEQIVPTPGDKNIIDTDGNPLIANIYDGFSRGKPAEVYGSIAKHLMENGAHFWIGDGAVNNAFDGLGFPFNLPGIVVNKGIGVNTGPGDKVYVDFSVDATFQMICFSSPVYALADGMLLQEAKLFLKTACNVRYAATQQFAAYTDTVRFRPGPANRIAKRPDVQLNVIGDYKLQKRPRPKDGNLYFWKLINTRLLEQDAVIRARSYLKAEIATFQVKGGITVEYNGIEAISLDGSIAQVSWSIQGGEGIKTVASRNMEHSTYITPMAARRRAENLTAVARAQIGNGRQNNPTDPYTSPGRSGNG